MQEHRQVKNCGEWAAGLPGTCQVGRLVRRPGGPPRSNVWSRSNDLSR